LGALVGPFAGHRDRVIGVNGLASEVALLQTNASPILHVDRRQQNHRGDSILKHIWADRREKNRPNQFRAMKLS
jgi:hypothetical protein